ncbi:hypothetical protein ABPG75_005730 [Micractinium tetrahymenae]
MLAGGCGFRPGPTICNTKGGHCGTFITTYPFTLCCWRTYLPDGVRTTSTCAAPGKAGQGLPPPKPQRSPPPPKKKPAPPPPKKKPRPPPIKRRPPPPPTCSKRGGQCIVAGKRCCARLRCFRYLTGYGVCL